MRAAHAQLIGERSPWLTDEQIIQGKECAASKGDWPKKKKRQDKENEADQHILPGDARAQIPNSYALASIATEAGLTWRWRQRISKTRTAASNFTGTVILL